ncbi:MAG: M20/M25/M40 family metallo-hydrolase [Halolamina sp.]|uniref:M20/M25/M40 family metallo-hydrolase n=1 Tax=Halolamina sp. TaxID=1940283 RepID=UPI002FC29AF0
MAANRHIELVRENAWQLLGEELIVHGTNGFIDAPFFAASGAKTLKYGPGGEHSTAHGPDESADLGQIAETAAVMTANVIDIGRKEG